MSLLQKILLIITPLVAAGVVSYAVLSDNSTLFGKSEKSVDETVAPSLANLDNLLKNDSDQTGANQDKLENKSFDLADSKLSEPTNNKIEKVEDLFADEVVVPVKVKDIKKQVKNIESIEIVQPESRGAFKLSAADIEKLLDKYKGIKSDYNKRIEDMRSLESKLDELAKVLAKREESNLKLSYELSQAKSTIREKEKALDVYKKDARGLVEFGDVKRDELDSQNVQIERLTLQNADLMQEIEKLSSVENDNIRLHAAAIRFKQRSKIAEDKASTWEGQLKDVTSRKESLEFELARLSNVKEEQLECQIKLSDLENRFDFLKAGGEFAQIPAVSAPLVTSRARLSARGGGDSGEEDRESVRVIKKKVNLRLGPGEQHSPFLTVGKGAMLLVERKERNWYRVIAPTGKRLYVRKDMVEFVSRDSSGREVSSAEKSVGRLLNDAPEDRRAFELLQRLNRGN